MSNEKTMTVEVPATGTLLVVDGVVRRVKTQVHPDARYVNIELEPPKPSFFEAGKTYVWGGDGVLYIQGRHFDCVRVDTDSRGNPVAYGRFYGGEQRDVWETRRFRRSAWKEVDAVALKI